MINKLLVLISGSGTNLQAIIDASHIINANVEAVISNRKNAYGLVRAQEANITTYYKPFLRKKISRFDYDCDLANFINTLDIDLIVLAGWMHILGHDFLSIINKPIINLHPALPGEFPGIDAVKYAFDAFKEGKVKRTGIMVHHVVREIDAGAVINTVEVPIFSNDTEDSLRERIRYFEKPLLVSAINQFFNSQKNKVREVRDIGDNMLIIKTSNRQSAFDRYICDVNSKGEVLTQVSAMWFKETKNIIDNHYLWHQGNIMVVKKCIPIKVEVVVRGYITGNTKTSLWTHYRNGCRNYCGYFLPDGLIENQKLPANIVTPTTKDIVDEPISGDEIVARNILTSDEWNFIENSALKLFEYGQQRAAQRGLILVDTKYEFGKDINCKIILIDEVHTCDSSRYWDKSAYVNDGQVKKFDKDVIRDWIKERCDPYTDNLPEIPAELIERVEKVYREFEKIIL